MKNKTLHMIGSAHIDPVWLWQWHEGFHEVLATFRSALDRIKEYDDFIFAASSAAFYEWVETSDPAMFAEIQQRVREGRWQVVGGWWIEPDCNIPSGESFVRQGLYGQRYFREKFGVLARVGYNVDSFGHAGTLPQILLKSGIPYYTFLRPMPHEKSLPARLFWWEADDGSRVLSFRIPFEYLSWGKEIDHHVERVADEIRAPFDEIMCFYGVGNHGGGPTIANLDSIRRLSADPDAPNVIFSSPEAFFESVRSKALPIPVVHGDLQKHAAGCYAAHSGIKRWNRLAENRLIAAEKWSLLAAWVNQQPYPAEFKRAWKSVLFSQFHDILAGTSLEAAYDDARDSYGEALAIADRSLNYAIQSFAWNVKIAPQDGMKPILVFNPNTWAVQANVELESYRPKETAMLLDDQDRTIPFQIVQSTTVTSRVRISFMADLPALGYRTYRLITEGKPLEAPTVQASDAVLENAHLRLEFDPDTGYIKRLYDKRAEVEVFKGDAAKPVVIADDSDTWGHNVFKYDTPAGEFVATSVRLVEHGAVKSVIRVISTYGSSTLIQDFTLYPNRNQIDVDVVVDWREQFKLLKLRFPVNLHFMKITHEIAYGQIEHFANGEETPFQSWVDLSGLASNSRETPYGFSLLNDGKYSMDVNVRDIGMTVLRSPPYAHHIPAQVIPGKNISFIDQGIQRFRYALLPHAGSWENAGTVRRAAELNQRPFAMFGTYHPDGTLPQSESFIEVSPDNLIVSVLKQAEEGDDLILRAYETTKTACQATIKLPKWNRTIEAAFGASEIKTFRIPRDPAQPITETNLIEDAL
ncbi:MAG: glycoside hydrolase family 38 C-terminal domain-containing protein [Chloroflexota bacterium]